MNTANNQYSQILYFPFESGSDEQRHRPGDFLERTRIEAAEGAAGFLGEFNDDVDLAAAAFADFVCDSDAPINLRGVVLRIFSAVAREALVEASAPPTKKRPADISLPKLLKELAVTEDVFVFLKRINEAKMSLLAPSAQDELAREVCKKAFTHVDCALSLITTHEKLYSALRGAPSLARKVTLHTFESEEGLLYQLIASVPTLSELLTEVNTFVHARQRGGSNLLKTMDTLSKGVVDRVDRGTFDLGPENIKLLYGMVDLLFEENKKRVGILEAAEQACLILSTIEKAEALYEERESIRSDINDIFAWMEREKASPFMFFNSLKKFLESRKFPLTDQIYLLDMILVKLEGWFERIKEPRRAFQAQFKKQLTELLEAHF